MVILSHPSEAAPTNTSRSAALITAGNSTGLPFTCSRVFAGMEVTFILDGVMYSMAEV